MNYLMRFFSHLSLLLIVASGLQAEQLEWEVLQSQKVENPPENVKLEYKFTENETRRYSMTIAGEGNLKLPGQTEQAKLQTNSKLLFAQRIASFDSTASTWHVQWDLIRGTMTVPEFGDVRVSIPRIELEMDKNGAIKNLKGLDKLAGSPGLPKDKIVGQVFSQLRSPGFPPKDLKLNETWEQEYSVQIPGRESAKVKTTSALVGFERLMEMNCAKIHTVYEAPLTFASDPEQDSSADKPAGGEDNKTLMSGTEKGEFWTHFAYDQGKMIQCHGTIDLRGIVGQAVKQAENTAESEPAGDGASVEVPKPDLDVKYHVILQLVPEAAKDTKGSGE